MANVSTGSSLQRGPEILLSGVIRIGEVLQPQSRYLMRMHEARVLLPEIPVSPGRPKIIINPLQPEPALCQHVNDKDSSGGVHIFMKHYRTQDIAQ